MFYGPEKEFQNLITKQRFYELKFPPKKTIQHATHAAGICTRNRNAIIMTREPCLPPLLPCIDYSSIIDMIHHLPKLSIWLVSTTTEKCKGLLGLGFSSLRQQPKRPQRRRGKYIASTLLGHFFMLQFSRNGFYQHLILAVLRMVQRKMIKNGESLERVHVHANAAHQRGVSGTNHARMKYNAEIPTSNGKFQTLTFQSRDFFIIDDQHTK